MSDNIEVRNTPALQQAVETAISVIYAAATNDTDAEAFDTDALVAMGRIVIAQVAVDAGPRHDLAMMQRTLAEMYAGDVDQTGGGGLKVPLIPEN